jgi:hypothetical protein
MATQKVFAQGTSVAVETSKTEINRLLARHGALEAKMIAVEAALFGITKQMARVHGWIGRMKQLGRVAATQLSLFDERPVPDEAIVDHVLDIEKEIDRGLGRRERAGIIVSTIRRFLRGR